MKNVQLYANGDTKTIYLAGDDYYLNLSNGLVTAVGAGKATITVSTKDGSFLKQFCIIDVAGGNSSSGGSSGSSGWSGGGFIPSVETENTPVVVKLHYVLQLHIRRMVYAAGRRFQQKQRRRRLTQRKKARCRSAFKRSAGQQDMRLRIQQIRHSHPQRQRRQVQR